MLGKSSYFFVVLRWSVNKLARSITKWTKACDKRLNRLISYIHHTNNIVSWEILPNNADWDCFKTPILREIWKIRNALLEERYAFFGSHTFVPISWMCKKQTSVSHSSTESEIISLDTGEGAEKAPGREKTHKALTNQLERPSEPRSRLPDWVRTHEPEELVVLDGEVREESSQLQTWRSTRPSWHVCRTFEASPGCDGNHHVRQLFCQGLAAVRLGRMTALQKPDGGVRGIIVGDYFRRLVSRTLAKAIAQKAEDATSPFQHALKTRAGCECVAHMVQASTEFSDSATIVSVDGVGAYDFVSRTAMLSGLLFQSMWDDEVGDTHEIRQGEGRRR